MAWPSAPVSVCPSFLAEKSRLSSAHTDRLITTAAANDKCSSSEARPRIQRATSSPSHSPFCLLASPESQSIKTTRRRKIFFYPNLSLLPICCTSVTHTDTFLCCLVHLHWLIPVSQSCSC